MNVLKGPGGMKGPASCTVLLFAAALASGRLPAETVAPGSFQAALSEYRAGNFEAAHAAFLSLAELGDCSAQFNLAAMALHGQGGPQDRGSGAGWLEAAGGNGCGQLVGDSLKELTPKLSPEEANRARDIVARYGPQALRAQGVVEPDFICSDRQPPRVVAATTAETPARARGHQPAFVITALTIGTDGHARDPEVLLAKPDDTFVAASVEGWLNSQFMPGQHGSSAVPARLEATSLFMDHGSLTESEFFRSARSAADAGDPAAEYLVGLAATHNGSLGISEARAKQLMLEAARDGFPDAQYWVGSQLRASAACHPAADGAVWLRHAADGGSAAAQLLLAQDLLAGSPDDSQLARARTLLGQASRSDAYYVRKHVVALLATSPLDAVRDAPAALELARRLAAFNITTDPQLYEAVAAAFAANGDFRNATAQQQLAVQKASALGWNTHVMSEQLDAYRHDRAWRGELLASF
jgi:TPR repeat protein